MKTCTKCKMAKDESDFYTCYGKPQSRCKACVSVRSNSQRLRDAERLKARRGSPTYKKYQQKWKLANPGKSAEYSLRYRLKNLDTKRSYARAYAKTEAGKAAVLKWRVKNHARFRDIQKGFWRANAEHRLRCGLAGRIRMAVKRQSGTKAAKTLELIGCSVRSLREHLARGFRPGMTWENYGPVWHIDHIRPCAKFDLTDPDQQKACFHWTNLQPLFATENIRKRDKI